MQESLWQTVRGDFSQASGKQLLGVAGLLMWMAFQWGWGNDILLPPIVATAFEAVDDGDTWGSGIAATTAATAAGGLFWAFTQALDGIIVLAGIRLVPGITQRISNFLNHKNWVKPFSEMSIGTRFLIAYATGASMLCMVDVFATGKPGLRTRTTMLAQAVALAAAGVALAVAVVSALAALGTRVPATADQAEVAVRYARNPLTWLLIYGVIIGFSALVKKVRTPR